MAAKLDETLADMTAVGAFGPDSLLVSFKLEGLHTEQNQFASCVLYGLATVDDRDGRRRSHRLVFKFKYPTPELRECYKNDNQFHNEILFYERIAPFLLASGSQRIGRGTTTPTLCRYFYGRNDCEEQAHRDVIVLENETVRGYRTAVTGHRLSLDFDHLIVALRALAKFHGLSYKAKNENIVEFMEMVADVRETHWSEVGEWILQPSVLQGLFSVAIERLKERHISGDGCGDDEVKWITRFQTEMLADTMKSLRRVVVPTEPIAVLCHGDFNRNNLLFRYDDGGRPVDALAYDLATIRYGSPALDLSFFLYMNTDRRTRDDHWDALLDAYCDALAAATGDVSVPLLDRDRLNAEISEYGFHGLAHVSYFARVMLEERPIKQEVSEEFFNFDELQVLNLLVSNGGEPATEWVADTFQHFIRCKYARTPAANENDISVGN
ncbi:PREDICTED: uncharacterized protein LOC107165001 [Diuraphis noxia]|uniref:uncharacterized protein LOC107165001 n=1 Tax=Diuraphis noxia TaxID=143948 RepID=UPI000763B44D|nr:PREDICTED: uncharacterized protein LOC107165001 [Diuraphis noxia]